MVKQHKPFHAGFFGNIRSRFNGAVPPTFARICPRPIFRFQVLRIVDQYVSVAREFDYVGITARLFLDIRGVNHAFMSVKDSIQHYSVGMGGTTVGENNRLFVVIVPVCRRFGYFWGLPVVAQIDTLIANQRPNLFFRIESIEPNGKKRRLHGGPQSFSQRSFSRTRTENVDSVAFIKKWIKKIKAEKMV